MTEPETYTFEDAGGIPNSLLPVLVYHDVDGALAASECVDLFARNGWLGAWLNGIFTFDHFHSTVHEVLGIVAGSAAVILGGPRGRRFEVARGDILVLPAGTGHYNAGSSADLLVVGAYPNGMQWDLRRGDSAERDEVLANIAASHCPQPQGQRPGLSDRLHRLRRRPDVLETAGPDGTTAAKVSVPAKKGTTAFDDGRLGSWNSSTGVLVP